MGKTDAGSRVWMTTTTGLRSADSEASQVEFGPDLPALRGSVDRRYPGPAENRLQALVRTWPTFSSMRSWPRHGVELFKDFIGQVDTKLPLTLPTERSWGTLDAVLMSSGTC